MKKILLISVTLMLSISLFGCNKTKDSQAAEGFSRNDLFRFIENNNGIIKRYQFLGRKNKAGFLSVPLQLKEELRLHWFVWSNDQTKIKNISIKAINKESDYEIRTKDYKLNEVGTPITNINDKGLIPIKNSILETTKQRPVRQAIIPITLPKEGVWEFIVFVNGEEFAKFNISVPKIPTKVKNLKVENQ
jgi:hypothetical protein